MDSDVFRRPMPAPKALPWFLALLASALCSFVSVRFTFFHPIPYALSFLTVSIFGTVYGFLPSIVVVAASVLFRAFFRHLYTPELAPLTVFDLLAGSVLLLVAIVVSLLTRSRRIASAQLHLAHADLRERTDALAESLHNSKCASWMIDLGSGKSARWAAGSYQIFGRPFAEIEQMPSLLSLLHPEDQVRFPKLVQHMHSSSEPILWEYRTTWPSGELHWLEMRATRIPGRSACWRGVTFDITERKLTELALLHSEKLAAMGRLASTVAHEINNPLEAVTNLLYLARADKSLSPETLGYLTTAEREVARLGEITRLTLGFVRNAGKPQLVHVAELVEDVLSIFRQRLESRHIAIERDYQAGVCIEVVPHELRQIITNLISNSVDAVSGPDARIAVHIAASARLALVTVEDNGKGIPAEELSRVFDPFFSTKSDTGTGIGLWVTHELVAGNKGSISVYSGDLANGMKTSFQVELPLIPQSAVARVAPEGSAAAHELPPREQN